MRARACSTIFHIRTPEGQAVFAGAAVEAFVDVVDERFGDGLLVQLDVDHLMDTAARRIGFEVSRGGRWEQA